MVRIDKDYSFEGPTGTLSLADLFDGRRQLIVYHFMFAPGWKAGCDGCSWVVDAMTHPAHLNARDTSIVLISRAPLGLQKYQARMQWQHPVWYSSMASDFNHDMGATVADPDDPTRTSERHGVSVFLRDGDDIYRTYFNGARGVEYLGSMWTYLDLTPYGRQETWEVSPAGWPQTEPYVGTGATTNTGPNRPSDFPRRRAWNCRAAVPTSCLADRPTSVIAAGRNRARARC